MCYIYQYVFLPENLLDFKYFQIVQNTAVPISLYSFFCAPI